MLKTFLAHYEVETLVGVVGFCKKIFFSTRKDNEYGHSPASRSTNIDSEQSTTNIRLSFELVRV